MRPLSWIVIGASVAGLVVGTRAMSARRERRVVETPAEEPLPAPATRPPSFRAAPALAPPRPTSALAHLRGRVIVPPSTKTDLHDLEVTASDGEHQYEAATTEDGRFQLHLPARAYTVTAALGELVGVVSEQVRPGATEELTIRLQPGAVIVIDRDPREGVSSDLEASATRAGSTVQVAHADFDEESFRIKGLIPGELYDVTVSEGARKAVVRGIKAPATVRVPLPEPVTLRGAIGFEAGTKCPFQAISIAGAEDEEDVDVRVDANCHFQFEEVDPGSEVHLTATGDGWHLDEVVRVPAEGEPEPICLNPPCRDLPPVVPADLEVILTGASDGDIHAMVAQDDESKGCSRNRDRCEIGGLATDVPTIITVHSRYCEVARRSIVLHGGRNSVTMECHRMRIVEGVVRGRDTSKPGIVSCEDGGRVVLTASSVFELRCPGETRELVYRAGPKSERRVPVPPGADPAFVELTL